MVANSINVCGSSRGLNISTSHPGPITLYCSHMIETIRALFSNVSTHAQLYIQPFRSLQYSSSSCLIPHFLLITTKVLFIIFTKRPSSH
ncbi:hypothetical protein RRG08_019615 [Elysia crispata]|uniref:Uncharacterized protein n=1 Tax=Elysia crispata TaxID=231223 RepID=A0AAE1AXY8_9GAST|nr:hypothetical protein RRG08_019615 [Elysia crispata]